MRLFIDAKEALEKPFMMNFLYIMFSKKTVSRQFADKFSNQLKEFKTTDEYKKISETHNWN